MIAAKEKEAYNQRCCICGRFVGSDADRAIIYGGESDPDGPEEVLFCPVCIEYNKQWYRREKTLPHYWQQPNWVFELAEELNMEFVKVDGYWRWRERVRKLAILERQKCERCDGLGLINPRWFWTERDGEDVDGQICPDCNGEGYVAIFQCGTCKGKKYIVDDAGYTDKKTGMPVKIRLTCPACLGVGAFEEDEIEPEDVVKDEDN